MKKAGVSRPFSLPARRRAVLFKRRNEEIKKKEREK